MTDPLDQKNTLPKAQLCRTPTPLHPLSNLSRTLGGGTIWLKRDDETGLAFGGNKVRQLEYYLGEALAQGADTVLITGAVQSNFVRLAAAGANMHGLNCHIQLEERVANPDPAYHTSGNVLLDRLLGATLHSYPNGEDEDGADRALLELAQRLRNEGHKPYIIPLAQGHPPLGALGYIDCAAELLAQRERDDVPAFDEIVVASGSGATHAGLLFGLRALGDTTRVTGACVRRDAAAQRARICARCEDIAELLATRNPVAQSDVLTDDSTFAGGYGRMNTAVVEAIKLAARQEAVLVDPVYTAKAMALTIAKARNADAGQRLLMVHTGGTPALFAYAEELRSAL